MLSQALLNAVSLIDLAMVGRLGSDALAAVGYATQFFFLSQSVLFAVGFACIALMARSIGAGDPHRARAALAASMGIAIGSAALLAVGMLAAPRWLLGLLGAKPEIIEQTVPYLVLVLISSLPLAVSMMLEFGLRADRDSRTPMLISGVVTLVKIAGNALLIFGTLGLPRLELVGAGLATVLSQIVGVVLFTLACARANRDGPVGLRPRDFRAARPLVPDVFRIGLPSVGERVAHNLALLVYFRVLSEYGPIAVATYTVGVRLLSFSWIPGVAFGTAASTLVGQALGAHEPDEATRAGWRASGLAIVVAIVLGGICALMPETLAGLFTNDPVLVHSLVPFLLCLAAAQPALQTHFCLAGAHRGAGDTTTPFLASIVGNWLMRVPFAALFAFVLHWDVVWVWVVILGDHIARTIWLSITFHGGKWRQRLGAEA